jgi:hypothetical protein
LAQQPLNAEGRSMVEKLRSAQAGAAFDHDYFEGQLDGTT